MLSPCKLGDLNVVKTILKSDYDIYEKDKRGRNGFMVGCVNGHLNIVKYLVEINYNINEKDNDGMNGFMVACDDGHLNIVKYLVEINYNIHEKDNDGMNGFMYACDYNYLNIVIYLLEHGCEINEEYIKTIERNESLCTQIKNRMEQIHTFYDEIDKNLNDIDIRVVHEIKVFTYGLQNLKKLAIKFQ